MLLETANPESESGFDKLTQCSQSLQVLEQDRFETIELALEDAVSLIGFIDPHESHTFFCGPVAGGSAAQSDVTFDLTIECLTKDDEHPAAPFIDQISKTFDSLTVK